MHATVPPTESCTCFTWRMSVAIRAAVGGCGQRSGSSSSVRHLVRSAGGAICSPSWLKTLPCQSSYAPHAASFFVAAPPSLSAARKASSAAISALTFAAFRLSASASSASVSSFRCAGSRSMRRQPNLSTSSRVHPLRPSACGTTLGGITTSPIDDTQHTTSQPYVSRSHFSAIAPAATRPIVSRALERPPPDEARVPYFTWYVKSACPGRGMWLISL